MIMKKHTLRNFHKSKDNLSHYAMSPKVVLNTQQPISNFSSDYEDQLPGQRRPSGLSEKRVPNLPSEF